MSGPGCPEGLIELRREWSAKMAWADMLTAEQDTKLKDAIRNSGWGLIGVTFRAASGEFHYTVYEPWELEKDDE